MILSRNRAALLFIVLLIFGVAGLYANQKTTTGALRDYISMTNRAAYDGCLYRNDVIDAERAMASTLLAAELANPIADPNVRAARERAYEGFLGDVQPRDCSVYMERR